MAPDKLLSSLLLAAAKMHEESYDHEASDKGMSIPNFDFSQLYRISIEKATECACAAAGEPMLARPVSIMLEDSWNTALEWANHVQSNTA